MKQFFLTLFFASFYLFSFSQTSGTVTWGKGGNIYGNSMTTFSEGMGCCSDPMGNVYGVGNFSGDSIVFGNNLYAGTQYLGFYVVKYDGSGNFLWAKVASLANNNYEIHSICSDPAGNTYITGHYMGGSLVFSNFVLINPDSSYGGYPIFLIKMNSSGNVIWGKSFGGMDFDIGECVYADASANIYLTGILKSPSMQIGSVTLNNSDGTGFTKDIFVAKLDSSGNSIWAHSEGGSDDEYAYAITADVTGNVFVTGYFISTSITFGTYTLAGPGNGDFYIVKYSSAGNVIWAHTATGVNSFSFGNSIDADVNGNIYVSGNYMNSSLTFGSFTLTNQDNTDNTYDVFFVKYDAAGNVNWAKTSGGNGYDYGGAVRVDQQQNIYLAGGFWVIDTIYLNSLMVIAPPGASDPLYIAKYDVNGNPLSTFLIESGGDDVVGMDIDPQGNICLSGDFMENPFVLGPDTLHNSSIEDVFTTKISFQPENVESLNSEGNNSIIFPNPSNGEFNISFPDNEKYQVNIYNPYGEIIFSAEMNRNNLKIDLSNEANGIYLVVVQNDNQIISTKKITKN